MEEMLVFSSSESRGGRNGNSSVVHRGNPMHALQKSALMVDVLSMLLETRVVCMALLFNQSLEFSRTNVCREGRSARSVI